MTTQTHYEDGVLRVTRTYDAPREAVFEAWIETSKVQEWWGCADTTHVKSEIEPKLGGKYCHEMTIRGKHLHAATAVITEYDPPSVLAYETAGPEEAGGDTMSVRVEFVAHGDKTEVRLTHKGIPDMFSPFVIDGWTAAFGKLFRFLFEQAHAA